MIGLSKLAEKDKKDGQGEGEGEKGEKMNSKSAPMMQEMGQLGLAKRKAESKNEGGAVKKDDERSNRLDEQTEEKKAEMDMGMEGNLMGLGKAKAKKKKEEKTEKKASALGLSKQSE